MKVEEGKVDVKFSDIALEPNTEYTPVLPKEKFRIAHNFDTKDGYLRRGKPGDNDLSVAMFVKDEEETILKVLNSIRSIALQYIIGIDSTTSDGTRDIIEQFKKDNPHHEVITYDFEWHDDFSEARNSAIEKCTHSWILILDGHDVFDTSCSATLIDAMNLLSDDVWLVEFFIYMGTDKYNIPKTFFPQPRLLRNIPENRYQSAVHNYIKIDAYHKVVIPDLIIFHERTAKKAPVRSEQRRNMGIKFFEEQLAANPEDQRALFYLGNMNLEDAQNYEKAAECYEKYLAVKGQPLYPDERGQVFINLCATYDLLKNEDKVREIAIKGLGEGFQRRELWMIIGDLYFRHNRYKEAITYFVMATKLPMPLCQLFLSGDVYTYLPWEMLAKCYIALERFDKVKECLLQILQFKPGDKDMIDNIRLAEQKMGIKEKVKDGINIAIFDSTRSFIDPIAEKLATTNNVRLSKDYNTGIARMADLIWIEWATENAIFCTEEDLGNVPIIMRLHKYELFTNYIRHINFDKLSALIFVTDYIKNLALELHHDKLIKLEEDGKIFVIPNSVDTSYFKPMDYYNPNRVLMVGSIRPVKNYPLVAELASLYPDLEFHIIGGWGFPDMEPFFRHKMEKLTNIHFYGNIPYSEMNRVYTDIAPSFILNTSVIEGQGVALMECMSKGIIPLLYDYPSSNELLALGKEFVFENVVNFRTVLNDLQANQDFLRKSLRKHVKVHFDNKNVLQKVYNLVMNVYDKNRVDYVHSLNPLRHTLNLTENLKDAGEELR